MNKLYITKVLPDGYGVGVIPEMEKPVMQTLDGHHWNYTPQSYKDGKAWNDHLASLPTFLIHPSLNPKEGEFIEQWREGWEVDDSHSESVTEEWRICPKEEYERSVFNKRPVLLPLVEKKEDEKEMPDSDIVCPFCGDDGFDKIGLKHHLRNYCEQYDKTEKP